MSRKKANQIRGAFVVLTAASFAFALGTVGAIEMGAIPLWWGVIQSVISLAATAFFARCLAACLGV